MLSLNWIDYSILFVLVFYAFEGYANGFIRAFLDLINFVLSFLIGLRFYGLVAAIFFQKFSLSQGFSNALGFLVVTVVVEIILGVIIGTFFNFELPFLRGLNKVLGIIPGVLSGAILITFVLILIVALPTSALIKRSISSSKVSGFLLMNAQGWEKSIDGVFGGAISETINFLTVEPKSNEIVSLNFKTSYLIIDSASETYMFNLVNRERLARGMPALVFDNALRDLGRFHCEDMFKRGYFSHYTPEGLSSFDRMDDAGIIFTAAGENLALSPNTDIAMQGLMNSPGHKANILSTNFGGVGIGVIDGGIYGEMFCQEFTN